MKMNEWIQKAADSLAALHKEEEDLKYALEKIINEQQEEVDFTDVEQMDLTTKVCRTCSKCKEYFYLDIPRAKYYKYCPYCGAKIGIISEKKDFYNQIFAPKILSIEEIFNSPSNKVIWLEYNDKTFNPVYNPESTFISFDVDHEVPAISFNGADALILDDYRKFWRCWDGYVNDKQREKESWLI